MRTHGTLQQVYDAAKNYYEGDTTEDGRPINPVVRFENGEWMLESAMHSSNATAECSLATFDDYFAESYSDPDFVVTNSDEIEFYEMIEIEDTEE